MPTLCPGFPALRSRLSRSPCRRWSLRYLLRRASPTTLCPRPARFRSRPTPLTMRSRSSRRSLCPCPPLAPPPPLLPASKLSPHFHRSLVTHRRCAVSPRHAVYPFAALLPRLCFVTPFTCTRPATRRCHLFRTCLPRPSSSFACVSSLYRPTNESLSFTSHTAAAALCCCRCCPPPCLAPLLSAAAAPPLCRAAAPPTALSPLLLARPSAVRFRPERLLQLQRLTPVPWDRRCRRRSSALSGRWSLRPGDARARMDRGGLRARALQSRAARVRAYRGA